MDQSSTPAFDEEWEEWDDVHSTSSDNTNSFAINPGPKCDIFGDGESLHFRLELQVENLERSARSQGNYSGLIDG